MKKLITTIVSIGILSVFLVGCGSGITEETKPNPTPTSEASKSKGAGDGGGGMMPDFQDDGVGTRK